MVRVDQFLKALAVVESNDDPEAWGDGGQAMGRWQVHPARLYEELKFHGLTPTLSETWDQLVARVLTYIFARARARAPWPRWPTEATGPTLIAMYWHVGHWAHPTDHDWDTKYAARFNAALANAAEEMP